MKKVLFAVLVVILAWVGVCAAFAGTFSFDPMPQVPLFREPVADPYSFSSKLHIAMALDEANRPNKVYSIIIETDGNAENDRGFYDFLAYDDTPLKKENNKYINMKTAMSLGLLRLRYSGERTTPWISMVRIFLVQAFVLQIV